MTVSPNTVPVVHADSGDAKGGPASRVVQTVKSAVRVRESEIKRWRRTFDANAKAAVGGEKCVPFFFSRSSPSERALWEPGSWTANSLSTQSHPRVT
jgi:hypothetical protein